MGAYTTSNHSGETHAYIGNCSGVNCDIGWGNITSVPSDIADGDADTTYNSDEVWIYESSDVFYLNGTYAMQQINNSFGNWSQSQGNYYTSTEVDTRVDSVENFTMQEINNSFGNWSQYLSVYSNIDTDSTDDQLQVGAYTSANHTAASHGYANSTLNFNVTSSGNLALGGNLTIGIFKIYVDENGNLII